MKRKWILVMIIFVAVIGVSFLYFNKEPDIAGATPVDLITFDYSAVTDNEDFPRVNVTGVIDNMCLLPSLPLWSMAGGGEAGGQISITAKGCPGTSMHVTEVQRYGNTTWFHVQKYEKRGELQMIWDGWIQERAILQGPLPVLLEEYKRIQNQ